MTNGFAGDRVSFSVAGLLLMPKRLIGSALRAISLAWSAGSTRKLRTPLFRSTLLLSAWDRSLCGLHWVDDPIGRVGDIEFWRGKVIVADELGPNVKVFSPISGALLKTVGRAGDGPGSTVAHPLSPLHVAR